MCLVFCSAKRAVTEVPIPQAGHLCRPYSCWSNLKGQRTASRFAARSLSFTTGHIFYHLKRFLPLVHHPFYPWDFSLNNSRGLRFQYTFYYPEPAPSDSPGIKLSRTTEPSNSYSIHQSISRLDHEAMDTLAMPSSTAEKAHSDFASHLAKTKNTICGRHPIGVLLGALSQIEKDIGTYPTLKWVRYEQSSPCHSVRDSSVSYASAYVRF